ncbi:Hsp20/alpha crystallin family protein [Pollutimonas bauzanensis]|uniref:Heat shock protein Hsp20 n=1 Tax=Pollutimonas bauzanensis TaxID=658167 RepID=A0A1M5MP79_9BURK|nr:Hsp20/alpha crystallin family protein [Pollutimonas bauzanensis]SHG78997.1 heat shock protein Hsp20 [Pollutimonas bauzanensis]
MADNLTRFDPFTDIARFEPFRGLEDFFKGFRIQPGLANFGVEPRIKMDVSETEQAYTVKAEIPGVNKEDVKVSVQGKQVTITAETKQEKDEKQDETVVRSERYYGLQSRSFTLDNEIDDAKAVAKYQDGVLELSLPKKKAGQSGAKLLAIN